MKLTEWKLKIVDKKDIISSDTEIKANVPGDITYDLYLNGLIDDPFFGLNHQKIRWITESDFEYSSVFELDGETFSSEEITLEFDGIDTFATIYLNGKFVGETNNMFIKYSYNVKKIAKRKGNILTVKMISVYKKFKKGNTTDYFGAFNAERLFIRKAQCHFGWDWAPNMPGYGIWGDVRVTGEKKNRIQKSGYKSFNDGNVTLYVELNYTILPQIDFRGNVIKVKNAECRNDVLRYIVATEPNKSVENSQTSVEIKESVIIGKKNFKNFNIKNPAVWYPAGYGKQPLYEYKIELVRNGEVVSEKKGIFAFREVRLIQKPTDDDSLGYKFEVNGREVFAKGSNWVPIECFTGIADDLKYEQLIKKAVDANFNMLRVWGGGIYEKDVFYDLCDKYGIMVWQDMMFACADIPEDDNEFVENVKKEVIYQIERLKWHPSIVYWCGGNEKTGAFGLQKSKGDYFVDVELRGLITALDDTRPYAKQSPCSQTEIPNDCQSGDSHAGSYEVSIITGIDKYRENVSKNSVSFMSECAVMGAGAREVYQKIFPENKLWDMNECWDDRLMDNPCSSVKMPFPARQKYYAESLYGKCKNLDDFISKSMTSHAETMRAEIEFARSCGKRCGGFMNWMFSDIWPSATWAVVDYYTEPKQVYYQIKRSFAQKLATFVYKDGKTKLVVINESDKSINAHLKYGLKTFDGKKIWQREVNVIVDCGDVFECDFTESDSGKTAYLYVSGTLGNEVFENVWSKTMWKDCTFKNDYEYSVKEKGDKLEVTIKAKSFVKGLALKFPDNFNYEFSDNYIDMQAGERRTITVVGGARKDELTIVTSLSRL